MRVRGRGRIAQVIAAACLAIGVVCGGCGDDAQPEGPTVTTYVTRDFGREELARDVGALEPPRSALSVLRRDHAVVMENVPPVVKAIDGLYYRFPPQDAGERREQRRAVAEARAEGRDASTASWIYNVNGIETDPLPRDYELHPGDAIQWDLRDWDIQLSTRATVGAFPETFTRGMFGDRFPASVVCAEPASTACGQVRGALRKAGVKLARPGQRAVGLPELQIDRARVFVGRWRDLRGPAWTTRLDDGPRRSGVFARFSASGDRLRLLDWEAHEVTALGPGSGLVAAIRPTEQDLVWVVTGVDDEGVERAARALTPEKLLNAFAVAVTADRVEKLPLEPTRFTDR